MQVQQNSFKETQLKYARVSDAYNEKEITVKNYFTNKNLIYPGFWIFLRAFKLEQNLEVWIREKGRNKFVCLHEYKFAATSGEPGPKRNEGDKQIPEGVYKILRFNPLSKFHLSLGLDYPNASDKILGGTNPGGDIYIHGGGKTTGCIPLTDDKMKELYLLATEARNNGQHEIPVHIFPARMDYDTFARLITHESSDRNIKFWQNLQGVYERFEHTRELDPIHIDQTGMYRVK